ncbi:MAG: hypothetical protein V3W19_16640 [Desulfatiglandales bacterium]
MKSEKLKEKSLELAELLALLRLWRSYGKGEAGSAFHLSFFIDHLFGEKKCPGKPLPQ